CGVRHLDAGGGELRGALRIAPAKRHSRALRALRARALLEQQPPGGQPLAVPTAKAFGPPRPPQSPLPGAAAFRQRTATAGGLRHHDHGGVLATPVVCVDGSPRDVPLRRRLGFGECASVGSAKTHATLGLNAIPP
ncbi:MAG: hypothetical protein AN485_23000, partial [Anabaena sp. MDT14b]